MIFIQFYAHRSLNNSTMIRFLFLIIMAAGLLSNTTKDKVKTYSVRKLKGEELVITGKGESPLWKNAIELTDFIYPWEKETPSFTSFKALHSENWLYLLYQVKDDHINV